MTHDEGSCDVNGIRSMLSLVHPGLTGDDGASSAAKVVTADELAARRKLLKGPLVGVCSMLGKRLLLSLSVLRSIDVNGAPLADKGMRVTLDGGTSSNSSTDAVAFGGGSRGREANGLICLFLLGVAVTCTP